MHDHVDRLSSALAGRYELAEPLGAGGMGIVYRARDSRHDRPVAVKVLRPELAHAIGSERFLREIHLTAGLDHPHILPLLDSGDLGGFLFYVMPYVQGETLRDRLRRERQLPLEDAVQITRQVADALTYAHSRGVVHRDVKPENILLAGGHARVVDFGVARAITAAGGDGLTETGLVLGTPAYMSPEQAGGDRELDSRSDVYALGCVAYEMLAGHPPFTGASASEIVARHSLDPVPRLSAARPGVPAPIEAAIERALAKAPADRFRTAALFAEALAGAGAPPLPTQPAARRAPRRLPLLGIVALALVAGALLVGRGPGGRLRTAGKYERTAIAVLPFQNLSAGTGHAYVAGGLHDELLTQLAKVAALSLRGRASVTGYAGSTKSIRQIAEELEVGSLVEGSVQVVGERLRVNVQLVDAATDAQLWAERYDGTLDDVFGIQTEVAEKVVAAVGAALSDAEARRIATVPTAATEAYHLYLQGRAYAGRPERTRENLEAARLLFERAVGLDSTFALARAALSETYGRLYWFRFDPSPRLAERQLEEAETALRLAPDLPQAHLAMGLAHYFGRLDFRRALAEVTIARDALPGDVWAWWWWSMIQRRLGDWPRHFQGIERVRQLDPRQSRVYLEAGVSYRQLHRYEEAVRRFEQALALSPDLYEAAMQRAETFVAWRGHLDSLRATLARLPEQADLGPLGTAAAYRVRVLLLERQRDSLLRLVVLDPGMVHATQQVLHPVALYAAWAHRWRHDSVAARSAFRGALAVLDSLQRELPDDHRVHAARGLALAGLGRRAEAQEEARWLVRTVTYREDAALGPLVGGDRARILAHLGDADAAIQELERLVAGPSLLSAHNLRLDPVWDPIRDHPRFQALLTGR